MDHPKYREFLQLPELELGNQDSSPVDTNTTELELGNQDSSPADTSITPEFLKSAVCSLSFLRIGSACRDIDSEGCGGAASSDTNKSRYEDKIGGRPPVELVRCKDTYCPEAAENSHFHTFVDGRRVGSHNKKADGKVAKAQLLQALESGTMPAERATLETDPASAGSASWGSAAGVQASDVHKFGDPNTDVDNSYKKRGRWGVDYQIAHDELEMTKLAQSRAPPVEWLQLWNPALLGGIAVEGRNVGQLIEQHASTIGEEKCLAIITYAEKVFHPSTWHREIDHILTKLSSMQKFQTPLQMLAEVAWKEAILSGAGGDDGPEEELFRPFTNKEAKSFSAGLMKMAPKVQQLNVFSELQKTLFPDRDVIEVVDRYRYWDRVQNKEQVKLYFQRHSEAERKFEATMCKICLHRKAPCRLTACSEEQCNRAFHPECGLQALPVPSKDDGPAEDADEPKNGRNHNKKRKGRKGGAAKKRKLFCSGWCRGDDS